MQWCTVRRLARVHENRFTDTDHIVRPLARPSVCGTAGGLTGETVSLPMDSALFEGLLKKLIIDSKKDIDEVVAVDAVALALSEGGHLKQLASATLGARVPPV